MSENREPSMDAWLEEARQDAHFAECGMFLFHNGTVRSIPKARARNLAPCDGEVTGMDFSYDQSQVDLAVGAARQLPGIRIVRVWLNQGRLKVGDRIMLVMIGGDIRPHVMEALDALVGTIKNRCVEEIEIN